MSNVRETVEYLSKAICPRAPGSSAEGLAAEYLAESLSKLGIRGKIEPFESASHRSIRSTLSIASGGNIGRSETERTFASFPCQFAEQGEAAGPLVFLGDCDETLHRSTDVAGRIGLLFASGEHSERTAVLKSLRRRGMAGAIVVGSQPDFIDTKLFRYPDMEMPIVSVTYRAATEIKRHEGELFELSTEAEERRSDVSRNVVATLPGESDTWLVLGAHIDSAPFSPGASDNATGVAAVLELARRLQTRRRAASIVLLFCGSEEYGAEDGSGRGARSFFLRRTELLDSCIGYVDLDSIGNLLAAPQIHLYGPRPFREAAVDDTLRDRYRVRRRFASGGDHGAAEDQGVPFIWFTDLVCDYHPYLHTSEDTVEYVDFDRLEGMLDDVEGVLERLSAIAPPYPTIREGGLTIRQARAADVERILDITEAAYGRVSGDRMRQDYFGQPLGGREWYEYKRASVEESCEEHLLWTVVAEIGKEVIGFATYLIDDRREMGQIGDNAVHPDFQGKGIGTRLQREVDRRLREEGYERFVVSTLSNDIAAQRLYTGFGYEKYSETYHYARLLRRTE